LLPESSEDEFGKPVFKGYSLNSCDQLHERRYEKTIVAHGDFVGIAETLTVPSLTTLKPAAFFAFVALVADSLDEVDTLPPAV
jgi:hypothetical protein